MSLFSDSLKAIKQMSNIPQEVRDLRENDNSSEQEKKSFIGSALNALKEMTDSPQKPSKERDEKESEMPEIMDEYFKSLKNEKPSIIVVQKVPEERLKVESFQVYSFFCLRIVHGSVRRQAARRKRKPKP